MQVRRCVRPYFLATPQHKFFYDCCTFIAVKVFLAYSAYPFALLHWSPGIAFFQSVTLPTTIEPCICFLLQENVLCRTRLHAIRSGRAASHHAFRARSDVWHSPCAIGRHQADSVGRCDDSDGSRATRFGSVASVRIDECGREQRQ